jgi:undecaprenyl-diphosphatase
VPLHLVARADQAIFAAVNRAHTPFLDHTVPRISRAADFTRLWIGSSAVLLAAGGEAEKRGVARGWLSIAITSVIVNVPLKPIFKRSRPELHGVPALRVLRRYPKSASFPSGHSASAAAFSTAVGIDSPKAGALLAPLAAAVCFSRVYTGAHHPSDVLVGAAIGFTVAQASRRYAKPLRERGAASRIRLGGLLPQGSSPYRAEYFEDR